MFKRILVPLEGSETAEKVVPIVVAEWSLLYPASLLLAVVIEVKPEVSRSS